MRDSDVTPKLPREAYAVKKVQKLVMISVKGSVGSNIHVPNHQLSSGIHYAVHHCPINSPRATRPRI